MASCPGKRIKGNTTCAVPVYKCKNCGSVGCRQGNAGTCSNQCFAGDKCLKCGKTGQRISI